MLEKEKVVAPESEEEIVEIEDVDAGITEKHVEKVKEEVEKKVKEQHVLNPEQQELFKKILEEAKMPVKMTDGKFSLGENELDIRYLSKSNKEQIIFRSLVLDNVYSKQILTSLVDITRLLMIVCKKLGVDDIVAETDKVLEEIGHIEEVKKNLKEKENKKEENNKA